MGRTLPPWRRFEDKIGYDHPLFTNKNNIKKGTDIKTIKMSFTSKLKSIFSSPEPEPEPLPQVEPYTRFLDMNEMPRKYKTLEDRQARHRTEFAWLFDPLKGVRWDFDPILCRELGSENPWVSMMIQSITKEVSGTPWQIVESNTETQKRLTQSPFKRKKISKAEDPKAEDIEYLLTHPDPDHTYQDMADMWMTDNLTIGSACNVLEFPESTFDGDSLITSEDGVPINAPVYIRTSDPVTWTKELKDRTGIVSGYWQYARGSQRTSQYRGAITGPKRFNKSEIMWNDHSPRSHRRYGLPPTLLVMDLLMSLDLAMSQEQEYFSRGSLPSGALVLEEYDRPEVEDFYENVLENAKGKPHKWLAIAGKSGKVDFVPFSYNFKDLQFLERFEWYTKAIASCFQVPTSVVGMNPDKVNYATFQGERGNFEANTLSSYLQDWERFINFNLIHPFFGRDYQFELIPGMSEDSREKISGRVVQEYQAGIVTQNEARRQLGYEEIEEGDTFKEPEPQPEPMMFSKDEPLRETTDWSEFSYQPEDVKEIKSKIGSLVKDLWDDLLSDDQFLREIERMTTQKGLGSVTRSFKELLLAKDIVDNIQTTLRDETSEKALNTIERASKQVGLDVDPTGITERLQNRDMTFADDYAKRMESTIRDVVSEGWKEGKTVQDITDKLREKGDSFSDYEAERIARDQLQRATSEARNEFALQHSDKFVEVWLSSGDNRVRPAHDKMDGKWKHPHEDFRVPYEDGVEKESFPGDSKKGIMCRCDTLLKPKDEVDPKDHAGA